MEKIETADDLKEAIRVLEKRQSEEGSVLKLQLHQTVEDIKPLSMIRNTIREISTAPEFRNNLFGAAAGMLTGYLSKAVVVGASHNPFKKLLGSILQMTVSIGVANHPQIVKSAVRSIAGIFEKNKTKSAQNKV